MSGRTRPRLPVLGSALVPFARPHLPLRSCPSLPRPSYAFSANAVQARPLQGCRPFALLRPTNPGYPNLDSAASPILSLSRNLRRGQDASAQNPQQHAKEKTCIPSTARIIATVSHLSPRRDCPSAAAPRSPMVSSTIRGCLSSAVLSYPLSDRTKQSMAGLPLHDAAALAGQSTTGSGRT